ncbi:MAG: sulfatase-like hydrolase/transferase [Acidobacteria bacterium]|nr:sulfatase-like hydrolase/transferase [Acidobacteriota bacterium]
MSPVSRRKFGKSLLSTMMLPAAFPGSALSSQGASPGRRPNIVFVICDQHSGRFLGLNGFPLVQTPNLDRLAARGVNFQNCYSSNPVCVAARASLMTGMFASDVDSFGNATPLGPNTPSWGNYLRSHGYYCWATGKMDLTQGADYGFHEVDTSNGHSRNPDITALFRAPVCMYLPERPQVNGWFKDHVSPDQKRAQRAIGFLRHDTPQLRQPWAMYVGFTMPHPRWVAQRKYLDIYPPEKMPLPVVPLNYLDERSVSFTLLANYHNVSAPVSRERIARARAAYFGMISELDEYVGWLFDELDRRGEAENTLFIYTSDHGEMLGSNGLWFKDVLLENAARVPLIMAGAGLPQGKTLRAPVSHVDMVATILDVAGVPRPQKLRGHSLLPLIREQAGAMPEFVFSESHSEGNITGSFMIRKGDWKYIYFTGDKPLLFNLKDDPGEMHNLAEKPEMANLLVEMHRHLTSLLDPDAVTYRAFDRQHQILMNLVDSLDAESFHKRLVSRMGPAQSRVLTYKLYKEKAARKSLS